MTKLKINILRTSLHDVWTGLLLSYYFWFRLMTKLKINIHRTAMYYTIKVGKRHLSILLIFIFTRRWIVKKQHYKCSILLFRQLRSGLPTVIITQRGLQEWMNVFDNHDVFKAIMSKFFNKAYTLDFSGRSFYSG